MPCRPISSNAVTWSPGFAKRLPAGARLVLQIHDELIVEAEDACVEQASQALTEAMVGAIDLAVPLPAEVHVGSDWLAVSE